jgi:hypothetical protein
MEKSIESIEVIWELRDIAISLILVAFGNPYQ